jgi:hypothetical protein
MTPQLRSAEYEKAGVAARWLAPERARNAYDYALKYSRPERYGLNEQGVSNIDRLVIGSYSVADAWLKERFDSNGTVQIVYGESEVSVMDTTTFLMRWRDIFCPGRDDSIVIHNLSPAILFYCHEEELEIGQRIDLL